MTAYMRRIGMWIQKLYPWLEGSCPWLAIGLIVHMFYKVPVDSVTAGIFNIPFLLIICTMFVLYFTKKYTGSRSGYVLLSFALYALYIMLLAITDGELFYVKRGVYEYGFYQMILFAAAFLVTKMTKERLVKVVTVLGLPFVIAGVISVLIRTSQIPVDPYATDRAIRAIGFARSPLSLGMLSGIYCIFAFAQVRMSRNPWYWIPVAVGAVSMLVSGSRGPMVAFCAGMMAYLLIEIIAKQGKKAIKPIVITVVVLLVLAILFFTSDLEFKNHQINAMYIRLKRIVDWSGDAGNVGRIETWEKWFGVFRENLWVGIGMSRTGSWSQSTLGVTESGFLRHLVELGLIGSILYYNLIVSCIVSAVGALKKSKVKPDHFLLLNIAIIVLVLVEDMVLQITEEITVAFFLWWCLGVLLGCAHSYGNKTRVRLRDGRRRIRTMDKKRSSISIVVTTYNASAVLIEQLDSLRDQTRQPDEVLILDDCSTDGTPEIVAEYIRSYGLKNWVLRVNEKNKGWKANFKDGLLAAKGDLVFPCDQDDIWREDKLAICEKIMEANPRILVLTSNYEQFGDCQRRILPNFNDKQIVQIPFKGNLFQILYPGCSYCIRREFLKDIESYWTPDSPHDATIWRYAMIRKGLYTLNDNLLFWRIHKTSAYSKELKNNHNKGKKRQWLDYAEGVLKDIDGYLGEHEVYRTKEVTQALDQNRKFLAMRKELYDHTNVGVGLKLLGYLRYYAAPIQYLGDWLHTLRK